MIRTTRLLPDTIVRAVLVDSRLALLYVRVMAKLTRAEIDRTVEKVVKRYDEYIRRFFRSPRLKSAFEERYFHAVKHQMDMQQFLAAEIDVVEELIRREEEKAARKAPPSAPGAVKKDDFADRILKEFEAKIEKYPEIRIHKDANPEIRHMLGALGVLDSEHIPMLQDALKNTNYAFNTQGMMTLDGQLRSLSSVGTDGISPRLTRYFNLLSVFPRDYKAIDREEKSFILEVSFFLHDLYDILTQVSTDLYAMSRAEQGKLQRGKMFIEGMIDDFRLKDFKRKNF